MKILSGQSREEAERWMNIALEEAQRALCKRAFCGTVIVKDGVVIGRGYNAPPLDTVEESYCDEDIPAGKPGYDRTCCVHAEWRAIMDALRKHGDAVQGASLYFTRSDEKGNIKKAGEPFCTVCSRLALDSGIAYFYLWQERGIVEYETDEYNHLSYQYTHV